MTKFFRSALGSLDFPIVMFVSESNSPFYLGPEEKMSSRVTTSDCPKILDSRRQNDDQMVVF